MTERNRPRSPERWYGNPQGLSPITSAMDAV